MLFESIAEYFDEPCPEFCPPTCDDTCSPVNVVVAGSEDGGSNDPESTCLGSAAGGCEDNVTSPSPSEGGEVEEEVLEAGGRLVSGEQEPLLTEGDATTGVDAGNNAPVAGGLQLWIVGGAALGVLGLTRWCS